MLLPPNLLGFFSQLSNYISLSFPLFNNVHVDEIRDRRGDAVVVILQERS
jgi:hypothetical protein